MLNPSRVDNFLAKFRLGLHGPALVACSERLCMSRASLNQTTLLHRSSFFVRFLTCLSFTLADFREGLRRRASVGSCASGFVSTMRHSLPRPKERPLPCIIGPMCIRQILLKNSAKLFASTFKFKFRWPYILECLQAFISVNLSSLCSRYVRARLSSRSSVAVSRLDKCLCATSATVLDVNVSGYIVSASMSPIHLTYTSQLFDTANIFAYTFRTALQV